MFQQKTIYLQTSVLPLDSQQFHQKLLVFVAAQTSNLLSQEDAVEGGEETPAGLDLLLLLVEGHVGVAALHGAVCGLSHQLPPPLLLWHEGGVADRGERVGDGDEGEEVLGGQCVGQLPVAQ